MVGGVLLLAGVAKVRDLGEFVSTVETFRLLPSRFSGAAARLTIGMELGVGTCLLVGVGVEPAAAIAAVLFSIYVLAILINLARHNIFNCNCFGPYFREKIGATAVLRNALLIILCLSILRFYDGFLALDVVLLSKRAATSHALEPFLLLTAVVILFGISVATAKILLKTQRLVKGNGPD